MTDNILIGLPSGEVINCQYTDKYNLFNTNLAQFKDLYKGIPIFNYMFFDKDIKDVTKLIRSNIKVGKTKIKHRVYGDGKITGIMDVGWIATFENRKVYVDLNMLLKNINYNFI